MTGYELFIQTRKRISIKPIFYLHLLAGFHDMSSLAQPDFKEKHQQGKTVEWTENPNQNTSKKIDTNKEESNQDKI